MQLQTVVIKLIFKYSQFIFKKCLNTSRYLPAQRDPEKPSAHVQAKELPVFKHWPPFKHGEL